MTLRRFVSTAAAIAMLVVFLLAWPGCQSSSEKQVVLYCSVDQELAEPIVAEFEKQTGIKVAVRYDTEANKTVGLTQKLLAERGRPVADVFWSSEVFHTIGLARQDVFTTTPPPSPNWPARYLGKDGRWVGCALRGRVICYNTQRVPAEQAPRKLEDLLDAKWKGRLAMADPRFGTTGGEVASWFAHYGPERARQILQGLKANDIRIAGSNSDAVHLVATGQADVCLTDTDDVYAAQAKPWPVAAGPNDQGGHGALAIPNSVAIVKNAPHPAEAAMLAKYLTSAAVEKALAQSESHNVSVWETISQPASATSTSSAPTVNNLDIDYEHVADNLDAALRASTETFGK